MVAAVVSGHAADEPRQLAVGCGMRGSHSVAFGATGGTVSSLALVRRRGEKDGVQEKCQVAQSNYCK